MIRVLEFVVDHYLVVPLGVAVGLVWANTSGESYFRAAQAGAFSINEIGMALVLAFLAQEVIEATLPGGTLSPWRRALLPVVAAAGGIAGAAAVYQAHVVWITDEPVLVAGWPVACAVDVAMCFFVAKRIFVGRTAVTFLLTLTIATDVIALAFALPRTPSQYEHAIALLLVPVAVAGAAWLRRAGNRSFSPYLLTSGTLSWWACFWGGVHPALSLLPIVPFLPHSARRFAPATDSTRGDHRVGRHFEYVFRYPVQAILFLFALLNGGVLLRGFGGGTWAILSAALVGRPLGILLAVGLAMLIGLQLPSRLSWRDLVVIALGASPGFTFALFFATALFPVGPSLIQTEMGAILTVAGAVPALVAARLLRVGRFAPRRAN